MKRYISSILIPCFLLQLFGCYTTYDIELNDIPNNDNITITTKYSSNYHLVKSISRDEVIDNPLDYFADDWIVKNDSAKITLNGQHAYAIIDKGHIKYETKKSKTDLEFGDIKNISAAKFDFAKTILLGAVISFAVSVVILFVAFSQLDFNSKTK